MKSSIIKAYRELYVYVKPYKLLVLLLFLFTALLAPARLIFSPILRFLFDEVFNAQRAYNVALRNLYTAILVIIGITIIQSIIQYWQIYMQSVITQRVMNDLRVRVYAHLQKLSMEFYQRWHTGEIISRLSNDITLIPQALNSILIDIPLSSFMLVGALGYMVYLNWKLTLFTLAILPFIASVVSYLGNQMVRVTRQVQQRFAELVKLLEERISGVHLIKSFGMEESEIFRFQEVSRESLEASLKSAKIIATQTPIITLLQTIGLLGILWFGGLQVLNKSMTSGSLMAFFTALLMMVDPIYSISRSFNTISQSAGAIGRIFELFEAEPLVKEKPNAITIPIRGEIEFKNVTFGYSDGDPVIRNISFHVNPGEIVALVGRSGAGKTTIVNLLMRFYDPQEGSILIDKIDIRDFKIYSLRQQMSIVPQDTILFSDTILENIRYGTPYATRQEVIEAAKSANAHDFIMQLPKGYDTVIGEESGIRLSGGQRQRIAIARAFLHNPKILILDEATSALDPESESLVKDAIIKLMKGRTTFIISHRLGFVREADHILVIENGEIVEKGTHKELLAKNGIYKRLYEAGSEAIST
ncbi:ABC transporter ATP-binding protein [bacterium]|nr:ABC transporter ATP-binding protein [bacterium]